jgi:hypothetical protein
MGEQHHMRQFLLLVFILLIPCFGLWTVGSTALALPAIGLVNMMLTAWFPDVVHAFYVDGVEALLMTEFGELSGKIVSLKEAGYRLGFILNTNILTYSIPFYTALHFSTQRQDYLGTYFCGILVLQALIVFGLLCLCLKELMVNLGDVFLHQTGVLVPPADLIGILYQLNVLIMPTLAPVVLWAWQSRNTPLLKGAFNFDRPAIASED